MSHVRRSTNARTQLLVVILAASAGVHGVLAPAHFTDGPMLGMGFAASASALLAIAVALDRRPDNRPAMYAAALLLCGLLTAYVVTRIAAVPLLDDHTEPVDAVGLATKLVEVAGFVLAINSVNEGVARRKPVVATEKGVMS